MSYLVAAPEFLASAAKDLSNIGSTLSTANAAAAAPTTGVLAAAGDEVSAAIAALFSAHGEGFQALSAHAAAFHDRFVQALTAGAGSYVSAEGANVAAFTANPAQTIQQDLLNLINVPIEALPGQPFSETVAYPTPFGPLSLTLDGEASLLGTVTLTGGTLQVPTPFALAFDALGPPANVLITLENGGAAFANAVQTGHPVAAAEALLETPGNAVGSFFFGQQTITEPFTVSGTQNTSGDVSVPVGGLLAPLRPVTFTLFSNGTESSIPLGGTEFGGLIPAIEGALFGS